MEDALTLLEMVGSCLYDEKPPCSCACPVGLNVRDLITKIQKGSFSAAYKLYSKSVMFPEIVSRICGEPCKNVCVRRETDDSVSLKALEAACCSIVKNKSPGSYYIPPKNKEVLVVGGGLTGLSCAVTLAQRGYSVNLHEMADHLGGRLWYADEKILPREILINEIERVAGIDYLTVTLNSKVEIIDDYEFDAALVATGESGDRFGALPTPDGTLFLKDNVLFGGRLLDAREDPLLSIREGIELSYEIESVIKVGTVKHTREEHSSCKFKPQTQDMVPSAAVVAENPGGYNEDEAKREAGRCILCRCTHCSDPCQMLKFYKKDPKKVIMDVANTLNKTNLTTKAALRQILSCTQCGACATNCPVGIDFRNLFIESRRIMHRTGALPEAHHEFWLNDMDFSNGEAAFSFVPPDTKTPKYLFFPGCQMGASDPLYVTETYRMLCEAYPQDVAIMQHCCGAPAYWAGRGEHHGKTTRDIMNKWEEFGKPQVIVACPTCADMFGRFMPDINTVSLWDIIANSSFSSNVGAGGSVSIFDPCSSRSDRSTQENIRKIVKNARFDIVELPKYGDNAVCCGYGGLIYSTNDTLARQIAEHNVSLGEHDYITYCVNCRDSFSIYDKPAYHILDVILFNNESRRLRKPPSLSERRQNRITVKKTLLKEIWDVDFDVAEEPYHSIKLIISDELTNKMDRELIHEDNVRKAIHHAESTDEKVFNPGSGVFTCHLQQGLVTYWVSYKPCGDSAFEVMNAYMHRMKIDE